MCSTGPFQFRWLKGYIYNWCCYHHQIGSIDLSHSYIFPWLCAWDVCYIIFCHLLHIQSHLLHIHSRTNGILFSLLLDSANNRTHFGLQIVFVCLYIAPFHFHHCANLSEDIEIIKCLSDIFCPVWIILSILFLLSHTPGCTRQAPCVWDPFIQA